MTQRLEELADRREQARNAGSPHAVEKHHAKGKMTARERLDYLLDDGSFQELDMLARHRAHGMGLEDNRPYTDGVITGFGTIDGRRVCVFSQDFTVFGGALGEVFAEKIHKVMDLAASIGVPMIGLNDGAGARIQEGVVSLHSYGGIFHRNAQASGVIPQISVILGPCAGGAVYSPAMTDFIFMVQGTSHMFITGPDVVKTVTGEDVTLEELGGAMSHATKSGVAAFVAPDEKSCLDDVRYLLSFLPSNNLEEAPVGRHRGRPGPGHPELIDLMPASPNQPYDMKKVVAAVVDDGEFFEVNHHWAMNLVAVSPASTAGPWASWATSPRCWPACSTSTPRRRAPGSCGPVTPSTSRWSPSWTSPASCPAPTRSTAGSSATGPSCSTPTASPRCPGSRSSPARPTAAPTWS